MLKGPCAAGSRWNRPVFSDSDGNKTLVAERSSDGAGIITLTVDGVVRSEFLPGTNDAFESLLPTSGDNATDKKRWTICHYGKYLQEIEGGRITMSPTATDCKRTKRDTLIRFPNPGTSFANPDSFPHVRTYNTTAATADTVELSPIQLPSNDWDTAFVQTRAPTSGVCLPAHTIIGVPTDNGGAVRYYTYDNRLQWSDNAAAANGAEPVCLAVPEEPPAGTAVPTVTLDAAMLRTWLKLAGRHVYVATNLRLESVYAVSPCTPGELSRWLRRPSGSSCDVAAALDAGTTAALAKALVDQGRVATNPNIRDIVAVERGVAATCAKDNVATIGAQILIVDDGGDGGSDGESACWEHVHPDEQVLW